MKANNGVDKAEWNKKSFRSSSPTGFPAQLAAASPCSASLASVLHPQVPPHLSGVSIVLGTLVPPVVLRVLPRLGPLTFSGWFRAHAWTSLLPTAASFQSYLSHPDFLISFSLCPAAGMSPRHQSQTFQKQKASFLSLLPFLQCPLFQGVAPNHLSAPLGGSVSPSTAALSSPHTIGAARPPPSLCSHSPTPAAVMSGPMSPCDSCTASLLVTPSSAAHFPLCSRAAPTQCTT